MKSYNNASFHLLQLVAIYTIPPLHTHHATFLYIRRLYIISYENATGTFCYQNTQPMAKELHKAHKIKSKSFIRMFCDKGAVQCTEKCGAKM